jgi:hypothetical protein
VPFWSPRFDGMCPGTAKMLGAAHHAWAASPSVPILFALHLDLALLVTWMRRQLPRVSISGTPSHPLTAERCGDQRKEVEDVMRGERQGLVESLQRRLASVQQRVLVPTLSCLLEFFGPVAIPPSMEMECGATECVLRERLRFTVRELVSESLAFFLGLDRCRRARPVFGPRGVCPSISSGVGGQSAEPCDLDGVLEYRDGVAHYSGMHEAVGAVRPLFGEALRPFGVLSCRCLSIAPRRSLPRLEGLRRPT